MPGKRSIPDGPGVRGVPDRPGRRPDSRGADEEPTERFPRIERDSAAPPRRAEPPRRGRYQPEPDQLDWDDVLAPQRTRQQPAAAPTSAPAVTRRPAVAEPEPAPAEPAARPDYDDEDAPLDDEFDELDEDDEESPAREWLVMASQLTVGAIGGAALWLGFQWLWQSMPVAALIVALVVITALVWIVRRIRRSDDLQTIVVTVLVGLFVTVSPAALLLLDR